MIGPGIMPIPPKGWGGVEALIWNYKLELEKQGHEVFILNTFFGNDLSKCQPEVIKSAIQEVNEWGPDFVHLQYDHYADIMPFINASRAMTSHYPYLDYPDKRKEYEWIFHKYCQNHSYVFTLSDLNTQHFKSFGTREDLLWTWIYGVDSERFEFEDKPSFPNKTICLGKIEPRKQQAYLQTLNEGIDFVGPYTDPAFNMSDDSYLGVWSREQVHSELTNYSSMILFSDGEAAPQVTAEALLSGCGLVVSTEASANLDIDLPFIDVVDRSISASDLKETIRRNRETSVQCRKEIREYGLENFGISKCVSRYVNKIEEILKNNDSI
jgi:glycosyltransferase involved in cell wall biosynthesis